MKPLPAFSLYVAGFLGLVTVASLGGVLLHGRGDLGQILYPGSRGASNALWTCSLRTGFAASRTRATLIRTRESAQPTRLQSWGVSNNPFPWSFVWTHGNSEDLPNFTFLEEEMYGWPLRMFGWRAFGPPTQTAPGILVWPSPALPHGTAYPSGLHQSVVWWPGVLGNIAIASLAGAIAPFLWSFFLRWRTTDRRHRGLCVVCTQSRLGLPPGSPCPECGAPPNS